MFQKKAAEIILFKIFEKMVISYLVAIDVSFSLKVKFVKKYNLTDLSKIMSKA